MKPDIDDVLAWTNNPPAYLGGDWTEADVRDVMVSKTKPVWAGYSFADWYVALLESRLRRALDGSFKRDPGNSYA